MIFKGYYLSSKEWIPVQIFNIDDFLIEHRFKLQPEFHQSSTVRLNSFQLYPYWVGFGKCKIEIGNREEAIEVLRSYEHVLKSYNTKN